MERQDSPSPGDEDSIFEPSLLRSLAYFGIPCRGAGEKDATIDLVLRGGPYTPEEIETYSPTAWMMRRMSPSWPGRCFSPPISPIPCDADKPCGEGGMSRP